jgi:hypothetical protein
MYNKKIIKDWNLELEEDNDLINANEVEEEDDDD